MGIPDHPDIGFRRAAMALALVAALASAGTSGCSLRVSPTGVIEPGIVPSAGVSGARVVNRDFSFEDRRVAIDVPVDQAVYAGSAKSAKSAIFIGGASPGDWVPDYYRAFVDESHQTPFYGSLASALHGVRQRDRLDAARYVELVTSMAQELEYRIDPVNLAPKFPIETFADGYGDCDDKTLLAAAALSRDGYDVAILLFTPEKHVALGIRAPGLDYKNTGYAYVEMTRPSLVGVPTKTLAGGVELTSQPVVIRIGAAQGVYTAGAQIAYIQSRIDQLNATMTHMNKQIAAQSADLAKRRSALQAARQSIPVGGDQAAQAAAVQRYNRQVDEFDALVAKTNALAGRYNVLVAAQRFVVDHQTARPQVYERLRALGL